MYLTVRKVGESRSTPFLHRPKMSPPRVASQVIQFPLFEGAVPAAAAAVALSKVL